jgi:Fe-S-cluster containining protein
MVSLAKLYDQIEEKTSRFCFEHAIACGPGCGMCCEHFMPDITALEARLVAAYLLLVKKDTALIHKMVDAKKSTTGPCLLYQFDSPYHCSIYPAMPLHLKFGPEVPVMQDYAYALRALDSSATEVALLPKAILEQLEQLSFLTAMLSSQDDNSNPDDTPNPQAC